MTEQLKKVMISGIVLATAILAIFALLPAPFSPESPALAQQAASGELPSDNPPVNFRVNSYGDTWISVAWEVPRDRGIVSFVLQRSPSNGWDGRQTGPTGGGYGHGWTFGSLNPDTLYTFTLTLSNQSGGTVIEQSVAVRTLSSSDSPTSTPTPISTSTPVNTPTPTPISTSTPVNTPTPTPINTSTPANTPVSTPVNTPTPTPVSTSTPAATPTNSPTDNPPVNFRVNSYGDTWVSVEWAVPRNRGITSFVLQRYEHDGSEFVPSSDWNGRRSGSTGGGYGHGWTFGSLNPDTLHKFTLTLSNQLGETVIEDSVTVRTLAAPGISTPTPTNTPVSTSTPTATTTPASTPTPLSGDAALSGLTLIGVDFGAFHSTTTSYSATVPNTVAHTSVGATPNHPGASYIVKLNGAPDADGIIPLSVGDNLIEIKVTAQDGKATRAYTVTVTRLAPPPASPTPTNPLSLNFRVTDYTANWVTVAWRAPENRGFASFVLQRYEHNGSEFVSSGSGWNGRRTGSTAGGDDHSETFGSLKPDTLYKFTLTLSYHTDATVIKESATVRTLPVYNPPLSSDATLSGLTLSGIDFGAFDPDTTQYAAHVSNASGSTQTTVTATPNHSGASYAIKLNGAPDADGIVPLSLGTSVISIEVTAQDGISTRTYSVSVTVTGVLSDDAYLKSLTLSDVDFGEFNSTTTNYAATVPNSVSETVVAATANQSSASYEIKLNGATDADGTIPLSVGDNVIAIEVTSEDGNATRVYTVIVTRIAPPTDLPQDNGTANFHVNSYNDTWVSVAWEVPRNRGISSFVLQRYEHNGSEFVSSGSDWGERITGSTSGGYGHGETFGSLNPDTLYKLTLTLLDRSGATIIEESATVRTTPASGSSLLRALALSGVTLGFYPTTVQYSASVPNSLNLTVVVPLVSDPDTAYVIKLNGVTDSDGIIPLAVGRNVITVEVTSADGNRTRTYTVTVTRMINPAPDFRVTGYTDTWTAVAWETPSNPGIASFVLQRYEHDGVEFVSSGSGWSGRRVGSTSDGYDHGHSFGSLNPDTLYKFTLTLLNHAGATVIEESVTVRTLP